MHFVAFRDISANKLRAEMMTAYARFFEFSGIFSFFFFLFPTAPAVSANWQTMATIILHNRYLSGGVGWLGDWVTSWLGANADT